MQELTCRGPGVLTGTRARAVLTEALPALNWGQWRGSVTTVHTTSTLWLLLCAQ
jgi:hypothetical protein